MTPPPILSSRRQRSLERKFKELDRKIAKQQAEERKRAYKKGGSLPGHRNWVPAPEGGRHKRLPQWLVPLTILALLLGASYLVNSGGLTQAISAQPEAAPKAGVDAADKPLGTPPTIPGEGGYDFLMTQDGSGAPVAWDPCRPIHYVTYGNPPAGGETLVEEAVNEMSLATGLQFIYDGPTGEAPSNDGREAYQPKLYGDRWAPLLVAWSSPAEVADLGGLTAGVGGGIPARAEDGTLVYVSGQVILD